MIIKNTIVKVIIIAVFLVFAFIFKANSQQCKSKYNTIAHEMSRIENQDTLFQPTPQRLDSLIDQSKTYIQQKENYSYEDKEKIAMDIYNHIEEKYPDTNTGVGCYKMSMVYLAIGRANNLPLYPSITRAPKGKGHFFVRWDPDGKHNALNPNDSINKGDINIEATEGILKKDNYFKEPPWLVSEKTLKNKTYLSNLSNKETKAAAYIESSKRTSDPEKRLEKRNKALKLNDKNIEAHLLKAKYYHYEAEDYEKALKFLNKAIYLDGEEYPYEHYLKGLLYYLNNDSLEKTVECLNKSINMSEELLPKFKNSIDIFSDSYFDLYRIMIKAKKNKFQSYSLKEKYSTAREAWSDYKKTVKEAQSEVDKFLEEENQNTKNTNTASKVEE